MQKTIYRKTAKEKIKLLLRRIVADILYYSGICFLNRLLLKRNQAIILMYHRVVDSTDLEDFYVQAGMYVTREVFKKHMEYLSKRYHVISLEELVEIITNNTFFPRNSCVITFDDGWKDFYTHAFPILKQYGLPATVFLVSSYVGTNRWFWPEQVSFLLMRYLQGRSSQHYFPDHFPRLGQMGFFLLACDSALTSIQKVEKVIDRMKKLTPVEIDEAIGELHNLFEKPCRPESQRPLVLNWPWVIQMAKSQITFGSHTSRHIILTRVSTKECIEEIIESKKEIEQHLPGTCWSFCYPNGDYNDNIEEVVREHYRCALTGEPGFVKQRDSLFALKRVGIHNDISFTKSMFACEISQLIR